MAVEVAVKSMSFLGSLAKAWKVVKAKLWEGRCKETKESSINIGNLEAQKLQTR